MTERDNSFEPSSEQESILNDGDNPGKDKEAESLETTRVWRGPIRRGRSVRVHSDGRVEELPCGIGFSPIPSE